MQNTVELVGMDKLVTAVQELSMARDLETVMDIVRKAARDLTGADGATFVLRDNELCYYAEENAITPLWKGCRFPIQNCISGWTMLNRQSVVIEDIYVDDRIPLEAYKPTFVKSLAMVPIRTIDPIGAIGNYWATQHVPSDEDLMLLQALADITAVSIENINMYNRLEEKLRERTQMLGQLTEQKKQLEDFCHIIAHNMRAPLSNLLLLTDIIEESDDLDEKLMLLSKQKPVVQSLNEVFDELVNATQVRVDFSVKKEYITFKSSLDKACNMLNIGIAHSKADIIANFDEVYNLYYPKVYLDSIIFNLLSNALKFRDEYRKPVISVRSYIEDEIIFLEVKDNGLGIDMAAHGDKLFKLRKTFHNHPESKGFGLFITKTQIEAMGGKIWAESTPGQGTTFTIQLEKNEYDYA